MNIQDAIVFMKQAHYGQLDKSGYEYWYHPLRVMLRLGPKATFDERCVTLLHDVLEDTDVTVKDMLDAGFSRYAVSTVDMLLTRRAGTPYQEYIARILEADNNTARLAKFSDLCDNLSPGRSAKLPEHLKGINVRHVRARLLLAEGFDTVGLFDGVAEGDLPDEFIRPFVEGSDIGNMDTDIVKWELVKPLLHFNEYKFKYEQTLRVLPELQK